MDEKIYTQADVDEIIYLRTSTLEKTLKQERRERIELSKLLQSMIVDRKNCINLMSPSWQLQFKTDRTTTMTRYVSVLLATIERLRKQTNEHRS